MAHFSLSALELNRAGVTLTQVAEALGYTIQYVSLQLNGQRTLDPALPPVVRALTDSDIADRVLSLIPSGGDQ